MTNLTDIQWLQQVREKAGIPEGSPMAVCYAGEEMRERAAAKCLQSFDSEECLRLEEGESISKLLYERIRALPLTVDRQRTLDGLRMIGIEIDAL